VTGRTINNLKIAYEYSDKGRCLQDLVQIAAHHRNMAVKRENISRRYDASGHRKIGRFFMDY
jgi:hypothetical protein